MRQSTHAVTTHAAAVDHGWGLRHGVRRSETGDDRHHRGARMTAADTTRQRTGPGAKDSARTDRPDRPDADGARPSEDSRRTGAGRAGAVRGVGRPPAPDRPGPGRAPTAPAEPRQDSAGKARIGARPAATADQGVADQPPAPRPVRAHRDAHAAGGRYREDRDDPDRGRLGLCRGGGRPARPLDHPAGHPRRDLRPQRHAVGLHRRRARRSRPDRRCSPSDTERRAVATILVAGLGTRRPPPRS